MAQRALVVLDLNGTLLHRTTSADAVRAARAHPMWRTPDATVRGNDVYLRPHLRPFLARLFAAADVAVWTSAVAANAVPMTMRALGAVLSASRLHALSPDVERIARNHASVPLSGDHGLAFLWSQEQCDAYDPVTDEPITDHKHGGPKPLFRKDLRRIWTRFPEHSEHTTLIVDDSPAKIACDANHVVVPEYSVCDPAVDFGADCALISLISRLEAVIAHFEASADIRVSLAAVPCASEASESSSEHASESESLFDVTALTEAIESVRI